MYGENTNILKGLGPLKLLGKSINFRTNYRLDWGIYMPYIESRCVAGKTIEVEKHYTSRYKKKGIQRGENRKPTKEEQKRINTRNAEKRLRRLLNTNFGKDDIHLVLDYKKEERPETVDEMKEDARKFLRNLRKEYKKLGKELKYIHVMEVGSKGARHHHLVINEIESKVITQLWKKGRIHANPLDDSGQYRQLASYLIKYTDKVMGTEEEIMGKRWKCSKNLKQPKITKRIVSDRNAYREEAKPIKGYYIEKDSVVHGIDPYSGYPYFKYSMVKLEEGQYELFG